MAGPPASPSSGYCSSHKLKSLYDVLDRGVLNKQLAALRSCRGVVGSGTVTVHLILDRDESAGKNKWSDSDRRQLHGRGVMELDVQ
jgi:hypothetical protein